MAFQFSDATINASLDAIETTMGASCILRIRSGTVPANVAAASTGTVLATLSLPVDWMNAATARSKTKLGTWEELAADAAGTAGHFEVVASNGTTRHIQGTVTATGGGGDMTLDNVSIAAGQTVTVTTFTINGPAA